MFNSKISDLFYAIQQNQITCLNCNTTKYNYQTYFFLNFPLEKVRQYILNNIQQNMNNLNVMLNMYNNINQMNQTLQNLNNNIVNIFNCFDYYQKIDKFSDGNAMYCNYCGQMSEANYCNSLLTSPKILILLLNRGKGIEFKIKLEFYEILNLNSYFGVNDKNNNIFKLIGVITHLGNSGEDGHFIAHCLSPINNKWYTYNDSIVTEINDFQKKIIDFGMPYLLFYHRIDENYK